jgi:hypothetical protein
MNLITTPFLICLFSIFMLGACKKSEVNTAEKSNVKNPTAAVKKRELSEAFREYWFNGKAELTSYRLSQERYGELREGTMVTIFVTEDFNPTKQVKSDNDNVDNLAVLKMNKTKKFLTGIYPYSIMTSAFSPLQQQGHALKVTNSVQEWCGQVYMQLNNRDLYEIMSHSYFESEADQELKLEKYWLEDELWNLIRINPESLPTGELMMIPSFESIRLRHKQIKAYQAVVSLKQGDSLSSYEIKYPEMQREVVVYFNSKFPFEIEKWEETNAGWMGDTTRLKTTAVKMRRLKTNYWVKNDNSDLVLRDSLDLTY